MCRLRKIYLDQRLYGSCKSSMKCFHAMKKASFVLKPDCQKDLQARVFGSGKESGCRGRAVYACCAVLPRRPQWLTTFCIANDAAHSVFSSTGLACHGQQWAKLFKASSAINALIDKLKEFPVSIRGKAAHTFHVKKHPFEFVRVRYAGLKKTPLQFKTLFALPNPSRICRSLMSAKG